MAEVVGTIAAAVQLVEAGLKLKTLCSQIKDMPNEISTLVEEIAVLADMLGDIRKQHAVDRQTLADDNMWNRCVQQLQASVDSMDQLNSHLTTLLQKHTLTGSFRVFLKRDELMRCREKLERAKNAMTLAQQTYSFALLTQQNQSLLHEIRGMALEQRSLVRSIQHNVVVAVPNQPLQISGDSGSAQEDHTNKSTKPIRKQHRPTSTFRFELPRWVVQVGLQVLVQRSNNSWGVTFRTYNRRSNDSTLFHDARLGDWTAVQQLFIEGEASPFDVDEDDTTLLSIAVTQMNYQACQFLCSHGIDPIYQDSFRKNAFSQLDLTVLAEIFNDTDEVASPKNCSQILLLLAQSHSDGQFDVDDSHLVDQTINLPSDAVALLTKMFAPSYEAIDPIDRAMLAMTTYSTDYRTVHILLGTDQSLWQALQVQLNESWAGDTLLLLQTAVRLGTLHRPGTVDSDQVKGWTEILSVLVADEAEFRAGRRFNSCVIGFLKGYFGLMRTMPIRWQAHETLNQAFSAAVHIWIKLLQAAGANIVRYGRVEKACMSTTGRNVFFRTGRNNRAHGVKVQYLLYGPEPSDWKIFVVPVCAKRYDDVVGEVFAGDFKTVHDDLYAVAGDFWSLIENPELYHVPGTFFPDADDVEKTGIKPFMVAGRIL